MIENDPGENRRVRIEMSLEEAACLYRLLAESDRRRDPAAEAMVRQLGEFLFPRISLLDLESGMDLPSSGAKSHGPDIVRSTCLPEKQT